MLIQKINPHLVLKNMIGHSLFFAIALVATSFASLDAQLCYRCFNGNWCNEFTDPDFESNVLIVPCPSPTNLRHQYHGDNPSVARILQSFEVAENNSNSLVDVDDFTTTWGCVTATIHEDHEHHTVRMCLNNAATICPTVQAVILNPDVNDVPSDLVLDCAGCVGSLCNDHTFIEEESDTESTTAEPDISTTFASTTDPDIITTSSIITTTSSDVSTSSSPISSSTQLPTTSTEKTLLPFPSTESSVKTSPTGPTVPSSTTLPTDEGTNATTTTPLETTTEVDSGFSLMVSYFLLGLAILVDCLMF
ncbi:serine-rich adhesin for platelets-like [Euwallacea fornicatus]|uniref:serine-rich adhesin for platelets-like n=1 Tax=Euwallacea fornicatus TaxID=995702 RepID=UPI00338ECA33